MLRAWLCVIGVVALGAAGCQSAEPARAADRWSVVEGLEACDVERLESPSPAFDVPWHEVSEGVRARAAVPQSLAGYSADRLASAAEIVDGRLWTRTSLSGPGPRYEIVHVDGAARLVLRLSRDCHVTSRKAGVATVIEMFASPGSHLVAIVDPETAQLAVHHQPIAVRPPIAGWFRLERGWGWADALGVHVVEGGDETLVAGTAGAIRPRGEGDRVSFVQPGRELVAWEDGSLSHVVTTEGELAAFALDGAGDVAWVEGSGPIARMGAFEQARLRWSEGELDLTGVASGPIVLVSLPRHIVGSSPGDGAGVPPSVWVVDRAERSIHRVEPAAGQRDDVVAGVDDRVLLQRVRDDRARYFEEWVELQLE
ncbi:hypothetical protein [Sandaracinus amylolyticus]|uniref:hypothetical protein n=1 Tax=Sandaracinus amylolyticus TaxID=927083 RepID=UPI001F174963|nr:hypothetical protein [Sandaracinus amylolyticus]UJR78362.1 Hypothetical protein I5071_3890 [Sandaracinus amylolyticus]